MSASLSVRKTADGSTTLYHDALNETYHSVHGALTESLHVFIEHGARYASRIFPGAPLIILEIGFGTGLNAFLAFQESARFSMGISFYSIEKFPLTREVWSALEFPGIPSTLIERMHVAPWDTNVSFDQSFTLFKREGDALTIDLPAAHFHVIFFDAFAPGKQPELWTPTLLAKMFDCLVPGGALVTYCAKGQFKRDLKAVGFDVEALPGPPGKREMVRAIRR
jgi:tRNA U34 5-methylaminomethyl-2-thiouridine-forming methyltransferase MnmC